jgi:hypothetical protein
VTLKPCLADAKKSHLVTMGTLHITDQISQKDKTDENWENRKQTLLKTDLRSVFGLLKTDRFRFRSRFPAGLYSQDIYEVRYEILFYLGTA